MTQPQEVKTVLGWEVDESSRKRVERALKDFRKAAKDGLDDKVVDQFGKRFGKLAKDIGLPGDAIDKLSQEVLDLGGNLDHITKFSDAFLKVEKNAERAGKEVRELSKIELRQQQFDAVSRNVGLAGDVQSNLGALNALSGGGLGPVGEIVALAEELPRLKTAIAGLPQVISQAASTLGPAGFAVAGVLTAAVVAFSQFAAQMQREADILRTGYDTESDLNRRLEDGSLATEQFNDELDTLNANLRSTKQDIETFGGDAQQEFEDLVKFGEGLGFGALSDANARLSLFIQGVTGVEVAAGVASAELAEAEAEQDRLNKQIEVYQEYQNDARLATNDAAQAELELEQARGQAASAAQQLAQIEKQALDLRASYDQAAGDRLVDELNRRKDAREDAYRAEQQRAKQFNSAIEKAKEASNKRLAKLEDELNNLPRKRAQELREAEGEALDERREVIREYGEKSKQDAEDLTRELNKIQSSGEKERKRILEDSNDSINEAMATGDVEALLRLERDRDKALRRSVEDESDTAKERVAGFEVQREREREALQKRLADIQAGLAKEQQAIRDSYAQRRDEIKTAIDEEKAAIKAYVDESTAAFLQREREIEEERKLQQRRRERDEAIAESRRQRDFNQQLTNLQQQANAITSVTYSTRELQAAARSLQAALASVRAGSAAAARNSRRTPPRNSSSGSSGGRGASGPRFSAFASGGVIDELTYAQMGEDARRGVYEAVIPFRKSEGIGPALDRMGIGGGSREQFVFHITGQFTVGDIASKSEVSATFNEFGQEIVGKVMGAVRNARRNSGRVA